LKLGFREERKRKRNIKLLSVKKYIVGKGLGCSSLSKIDEYNKKFLEELLTHFYLL
jgi:hypothetical protein